MGKRKAKDIERKRKRLKVGEVRRKSIDKGLFKDKSSLVSSALSLKRDPLVWSAEIPRVSDRTWGQYGAEWGGTIAGAAAGGVAGAGAGMWFPGMVHGAKAGQQAVRAIQWGQKAYNAKGLFDKENINIAPLMSVSYGGKMRKSIGKSTNSIRQKYQGNGAVVIQETYGQVADADVVGVGHITWNVDCVSRVLIYALLRKMFRAAGIIVQTPYEIIRMISLTQSGGFKLEWVLVDADGTTTVGGYNIPPNSTMETIFALSDLNNLFQRMIKDPNPVIIERIMLLIDENRVMSQVIPRQLRVDLTINAHTVVQNRTKSTQGSSSTDSVDAQPLKGPIFQFNGVPKTKEISPTALNIVPSSGVILFRKSQLAGSDPPAWSEPPVKNSFYNATKMSYVRLAPGVLKDMEISKTWNGPLQTVINRFRMTFESNVVSACPGISQLCFLEEELNSGSTNLINVAYETQHTFGALFTTVKAPNMQPFYFQEIFNNLPA